MAENRSNPGNFIRWLRRIARLLVLIWGIWWTIFGFASGPSEHLILLGFPMHSSLPGLIFLVSALLPWHWEFAGGVFLMLSSIAGFLIFGLLMDTWGSFPVGTQVFILLTLLLPPFIAGVLFLTCCWQTRRLQTG